MAFDLEADGYVIKYDGQAISLREIVLWDREPQYNDVDFLYNLHTLTVRGVINIAVENTAGKVTSVDIDKMLAHWDQPRKKLTISSSEGEWYSIDEKADCRRGPIPKGMKILKVIGLKTMLVEFTVSWHFPDLPAEGNNDRLLLSNRWSMTTALDENFYQSRTVTGRAVFDGANLKDISPDEYRAYCILPCPKGWRRFGPTVSVSASGCELDYQFTDIQQAVNIYPTFVSQISVTGSYDFASPAPESFIKAALALTVAVASAGQVTMPVDDPHQDIRSRSTVQQGGGTTGYGAAMGTIGGAANAVVGALPVQEATVLITVVGTPLATMNDLAAVAWACMQFRNSCLPDILGKLRKKTQIVGPATNLHWSCDYSKRIVVLARTSRTGPEATALGDAFSASKFFQPMDIVMKNEQGLFSSVASDRHLPILQHRKYPPGQSTRGPGDTPVLNVAEPLDPLDNPDPAENKAEMNDKAHNLDPRDKAEFVSKQGLT